MAEQSKGVVAWADMMQEDNWLSLVPGHWLLKAGDG